MSNPSSSSQAWGAATTWPSDLWQQSMNWWQTKEYSDEDAQAWWQHAVGTVESTSCGAAVPDGTLSQGARGTASGHMHRGAGAPDGTLSQGDCDTASELDAEMIVV